MKAIEWPQRQWNGTTPVGSWDEEEKNHSARMSGHHIAKTTSLMASENSRSLGLIHLSALVASKQTFEEADISITKDMMIWILDSGTRDTQPPTHRSFSGLRPPHSKQAKKRSIRMETQGDAVETGRVEHAVSS